MRQSLRSLWREEDGQDLVEYTLLIAFIAVVVLTIAGSLQGPIREIWIGKAATLAVAADIGR